MGGFTWCVHRNPRKNFIGAISITAYSALRYFDEAPRNFLKKNMQQPYPLPWQSAMVTLRTQQVWATQSWSFAYQDLCMHPRYIASLYVALHIVVTILFYLYSTYASLEHFSE